MGDSLIPKLTKWPFIIGDLLLAGVAVGIYHQSTLPIGSVQLSLVAACVALGALLSIIPFVLEYRAAVKVAEAGALTSVVSQISQVEAIAGQIANATGRWSAVQEASEKTAAAAQAIAERMGSELKAFTEFMQKANDSERSNLRLEVEKLRRGESEWLQVLTRVLDHVYALHAGAVRSGQPNLIEQLGHFQNACRDAARRVGVVPFAVAPGEAYDAKRHQVVEGSGKPEEGATVADTIATGYSFQGQLLRPALVRLNTAGGQNSDETQVKSDQAQLL